MFWINGKSKTKQFAVLLLTFILLFSLNYTAFAEGGEFSDTPGIPGAKPLSFVSIVLMDGTQVKDAQNIPVKAKFKLHFDKNVVNSTIWEINRNAFTLTSQAGVKVPISVTKVDDTVDFSQRQDIFVETAEAMKEGTTYILKVGPELKAKNGVSVLGGTTDGKGVTIVFKTQGTAQTTPVQPSKSNQSTVNQAQTGQVQSGKTVAPPSQTSAAPTQEKQDAAGQTDVQGERNETLKSDGAPDSSKVPAVNNGQDGINVSSSESVKSDTTGTGAAADTKNKENVNAAENGKGTVSETGGTNSYVQKMTELVILLVAGWFSMEAVALWRKKRKQG